MHQKSRKFRLGNMAKSMFGNRKVDQKTPTNQPSETTFRKFEMPSINTEDMADFIHTARSDVSLSPRSNLEEESTMHMDSLDQQQSSRQQRSNYATQEQSPFQHDKRYNQQQQQQQQQHRHHYGGHAPPSQRPHPPQQQQPSSRFDNSRFRKVNAYGEGDKAREAAGAEPGAGSYGTGYSSVRGDYGGTGASFNSSYGGRESDRFDSGRGYPARDGHVPHVVMDDLDEDLMDGILNDSKS